MSTNHIRSRWAAVGAATAIALGAGGIGITHATTSSGEKPIYLPIEPCRLADTRPAFKVGPRSAPLGPDETYTLSGQGVVGKCNLKAGTTALSLNVTAINATAPTFVTLFPAGAPLPVASHLNPLPGQGPVPNAVNVDLNGAGQFSIYNLAGNVDIIIDVVGVYDNHNHDDRYYTEPEVDAAIDAAVDAAQPMWAKVDSDGTLIAGSAGVESQEYGPNPVGRYVVTFPRDVANCAYVAHNNLNSLDIGSALAFENLGLPEGDVFVYIEDESGAEEDREFSLMVMC